MPEGVQDAIEPQPRLAVQEIGHQENGNWNSKLGKDGIAGFLEISIAVIDRDCQGIGGQAMTAAQPLGDGSHRHGTIVAAKVSALASERGAIGKAMVHQNTEAMAMEPSHRREAAGMMEGGGGGGLHQVRHGPLIVDQCSGLAGARANLVAADCYIGFTEYAYSSAHSGYGGRRFRRIECRASS